MATIHDVAKASGVSYQTVSNTLNAPQTVRPATRARVMDAVRAVGYHPSALARGLQSKPMNTLGLVLATGDPDPLSSPYYAPLLSGVVMTCSQYRQNAMLFVGELWSDLEHSLSTFCDGRCDGLILLGNYSDSALIPALGEQRVPFVLVNNRADDPRVSYVDVNDVELSRQMTEYLLSQGHRRIAFLSASVGEHYMERRAAGCRQALEAAGIAPRPDWFVADAFVDNKVSASFHALMRLPRGERPTALVCVNDVYAAMAMDGLRALGLRIPEDTSIAGFDDLAMAALEHPPLTTMRQPLRDLGRRAVEIVLKKVAGDTEYVCQELLPTELIVRQSVAVCEEH